MAALLAAAAVALWLGGDDRLRRLQRSTLGAGRPPTPPSLRLAAGLGGIAALLLLPFPVALLLAVVLQGVLPRLVQHWGASDDGVPVGDVALALDLTAAALAAGAVVPAALSAAGQALPGRAGEAFAAAARVELLGGDPAARLVAMLPGLPRSAAAAIRRALAAGTSAADPLRTAADEIRAAAALAAEARVQSAAVRLVLPIGLCFLPAFVLVGVVPVVAGFGRLAF